MNLVPNNYDSTSYSHSLDIFIEKYIDFDGDHITIGSIFTNKIIVSNFSDFDLDSAYLIDDTLKEMRYKEDSLSIDGALTTKDINLSSSHIINLGTLKSNTTLTVYFDVYVDKMPSMFPIISCSKLVYSYYSDNKLFFDVKYSNKIDLLFTLPKLQNQIPQYIDNTEICNKNLSDDVEFKIVISPKEDLVNAVLKNYLNDNLIFLSAYLINKNNQLETELFPEGKLIYIGDLLKTGIYEIIIKGKLKDFLNKIDDYIICNNPFLEYSISNSNRLNTYIKPVYLYITHADLKSIVLTDKKQLRFDDELTITIILKNIGTVPIESITIENLLPDDLEYIDNSCVITYDEDLKGYVHYDKDSNSVHIPYMSMQDSIEISIETKVIPRDTHKSYRIINDIYLNYKFVKYPLSNNDKYEYISHKIANSEKYLNIIDSTLDSDILDTVAQTNTIINPNNQVKQSVLVDKPHTLNISSTIYPTKISPGDTALFSIYIKNTMADTLTNVIFQSILPEEVSLVPNSFIINNKLFTINDKSVTTYDIKTGLNIGDIPIGESCLVQYLATTSLSDHTSSIVNTSNISYTIYNNPSEVYTTTATAIITNQYQKNSHTSNTLYTSLDCYNETNSDFCPISYTSEGKHPCPHHGKSNCRPGKRALCKKFYKRYR